jgi:hypothetical protein
MARRIGAGIVAVIGYLLSPLSWWNDAFINLPLAWLFASLVSLASHGLFAPAMIVGYWLTNVAGLLLMAHGTVGVVAGGSPRLGKRQLVWSLVAATGYTLLIVWLYACGVLRPLGTFFGR